MEAFDKVSHNSLILKFKSYDIGGVRLHWLKAFLTDRKQRVGVNDEYSEWKKVPSGPSGLSSRTCIICWKINDLPDNVTENSMLQMFADDTKLSGAILNASDAEILQQDIDNMDEWSRKWLMEFHPLKCKVLKMGRTIADLHDIFNPYTLRQRQLEVVDHEKDLEVTMDVDLIFYKHILDKISKVTKDFTYEKMIRKLKLPTLKYRRLRGDLVEIFKILTKKYDPDACQNLIRLKKSSVTRGHSLKTFRKGLVLIYGRIVSPIESLTSGLPAWASNQSWRCTNIRMSPC